MHLRLNTLILILLVHLPMPPEEVAEQPGHKTMSLKDESTALKIVVETALKKTELTGEGPLAESNIVLTVG